MQKKKILSTIIATLLMFALLSGCGSKDTEVPTDTEVATETENESKVEPETEPEEPEVVVDVQELWDNAWNDVDSVTRTWVKDFDIKVKRSIIPSYELHYSPEDKEEFDYRDREESVSQMMSDGSYYENQKYIVDHFNYNESDFDLSFSERYYLVDGKVFTNYYYNSDDDVWERDIADLTEYSLPDEPVTFIGDEPRDLEIVSETNAEWIVSGVVTMDLQFEWFTWDLLFEPESEFEPPESEVDVHVTYTFDKETGYLLKAEYNYEDIYNYYKTDFFEEGVIAVNNMVYTITYSDYNNSTFEVGPEITENCRDMDEY